MDGCINDPDEAAPLQIGLEGWNIIVVICKAFGFRSEMLRTATPVYVMVAMILMMVTIIMVIMINHAAAATGSNKECVIGQQNSIQANLDKRYNHPARGILRLQPQIWAGSGRSVCDSAYDHRKDSTILPLFTIMITTMVIFALSACCLQGSRPRAGDLSNSSQDDGD